MSGAGCGYVSDVAAELALGLLTGRERAACLTHLEGCGACRAEVSGLAVTADDVLLAGPRSAPPEGFDHRVLDRLTAAGAFSTSPPDRRVLDGVDPAGPAPVDRPRGPVAGDPAVAPDRAIDRFGTGEPEDRRPARRRRRAIGRTGVASGRERIGRRVLAGAALVIVVVVAAVGGIAGFSGLSGRDGSTSIDTITAEMRTGNGRLVGDATVRGDDPALVTVDLPGWSELVRLYGDGDGDSEGGGGPYWLTVELDDGSRTMNRIPPDDTAWEVPLRAGAGEVAAVSVVDAEGRAWCIGRFPA